MIGVVIVIGVIALIILGILWGTGLIYLFTIHERTLTIQNTNIDLGDKGSHYLVHGTDGQIVELERMWFQFDSNIDKVFNEVQNNKGKTFKFECWGFQVDWLYYYSNCAKIKSIENATSSNV